MRLDPGRELGNIEDKTFGTSNIRFRGVPLHVAFHALLQHDKIFVGPVCQHVLDLHKLCSRLEPIMLINFPVILFFCSQCFNSLFP